MSAVISPHCLALRKVRFLASKIACSYQRRNNCFCLLFMSQRRVLSFPTFLSGSKDQFSKGRIWLCHELERHTNARSTLSMCFRLQIVECKFMVDIVGRSVPPLLEVSGDSMAMLVAPLSPGVVVRLRDLHSASPFTAPNQSLRVVGTLERFDAASGIAILTDGGSSLRLDLEHLRELPLRVGSLFEFIGELQVRSLLELTLKARVGRNVDGMDLRLFDKVLEFRRKFEEECRN